MFQSNIDNIKMGPKTRADAATTLVDVTGPGEPMRETELPTLRGILRHGIYLQEKKLLEEEVDRRNYSVSMIAKDISVALVSCWQKANPQFCPPVIITNKSIERKIQVTSYNHNIQINKEVYLGSVDSVGKLRLEKGRNEERGRQKDI